MAVDASHVSVRNRDGMRPAGAFRQEPLTAAGLPAVAVSQDDSTGTAVLVRGGGTLLDLQNTSNASKFKVDVSGNVTAGGSLAVTGAAPSANPATGVSTYSGAGGSVTTAGGGVEAVLNGQGLTMINGGVVPGSVLTAASTVASTGSETQLVGLSIPAGDPVAGAIYYIQAAGVYSDTATPTLAFGLRYGGAAGTSITSIAAITLGSGVSSVPFDLEAILQFYDTTHAVGKIRLGLGTSASTNATSAFTGAASAGVSVTSATAKVMSVTVTWSASSSSNTISALTGYGMRLA